MSSLTGHSPGDPRLAARLRRETQAAVLFDAASRGRYATDASIYQIEPLGVAVPRTAEDLQAILAIAREEAVPVLPRGAGTSQCGQTVNRALVVDCSPHLRRILDLDSGRRSVTVEPGIVLAELNAALRPHGLFFPIDPSTHLRCTIGGMAGNNSCGAKSIRYGLMADNVRAIDGILADGSRHRFGPLDEGGEPARPEAIDRLIGELRRIGTGIAAEVAQRFPAVLRRVGGYNLDALTPAAAQAGRANLARLLVGSEGTLAFSAAIELALAPIKPRKVVGICQFRTFRAAMEASRQIVTLDPEAVELIDRTMMDLARGIPLYHDIIERLTPDDPESLLIVEFHGYEDAPLLAKLALLTELMRDQPQSAAVVPATEAAFQAEIAAVREAGLNIMMSMKGDAKPVSFIEDCAVRLEDLADYTDRLNEIFARHGTKGTWYAHASVGCLHVRPVLNMKDPRDIAKMRQVAEECFALVRAYKGSHSGEHGDGIVRSEFHERMFGPRILRAFEAVKDAFDPGNRFNPGRVVRAPRMDDRALFRYGPGYAPDAGFRPKLDWFDGAAPLGGMLGAVEMCNNNGLCRSFDAGVMCPSFRATRAEQHATRGRANTLRLALTGQLGGDAMASEAVAEAMALCVSCKACRRECPTGVDMAKMKIEVLAARAERGGVRLREWLIAGLPRSAPILARFSWALRLANAAGAAPRLLAAIGFADRPLPAFRRDFFRDREAAALAPRRPRGEVLLLADTFNRWFEPENLRAAVAVLAALGYRARLPKAAGPALCCGRPWLAAGLVDRARAEAVRLCDAVAGDLPILGLEPSCLLTLRDEFRALLPRAKADDIAGRALLLSEFIERLRPAPAFKSLPGVAHIHGHCHQKSFGLFPSLIAALKGIPGLSVQPITASCCGMAGAFGYQAETAEISRQMAELSLMPAVRAAKPQDFIIADGTSCRHQIADLAGRTAIHSVRLFADALS